jgi:hypothetical protein
MQSTYQPPRLPTSLEPVAGSAIQDLSNEAQMILKDVSKSNNGRIMRQGWGIQISKKSIFYGGIPPRERAAWEGAIDELEGRGFIKAEGPTREVFTITNEGYSAADGIEL